MTAIRSAMLVTLNFALVATAPSFDARSVSSSDDRLQSRLAFRSALSALSTTRATGRSSSALLV